MMVKTQPTGKLLTKSLRASLAESILPCYPMLPLLSTRKKKWNSEPLLGSKSYGSSSSRTSRASYGAGGSNVGTSDAMQATSFLAAFSM